MFRLCAFFVAFTTLSVAQAAGADDLRAPTDIDFQAWTGSGPSDLHGQAFLKTVGGDVKTCAGSKVALAPANDYGRELMQLEKSGTSDPNNVNPVFPKYIRETTCDAQGNFTFTNLPAQPWIIETAVTWGTPHIEQPGERPGPLMSLILGIPAPPDIDAQGGVLTKEVTLQPGDNQAFLTSDDEVR